MHVPLFRLSLKDINQTKVHEFLLEYRQELKAVHAPVPFRFVFKADKDFPLVHFLDEIKQQGYTGSMYSEARGKRLGGNYTLAVFKHLSVYTDELMPVLEYLTKTAAMYNVEPYGLEIHEPIAT